MKNVLITGASGALGKACVLEFSSKNYQVITILSPGKTLPYPINDSVTIYNANLTDEKDTSETLSKIFDRHKTIDITLLLVGGFAMGSIMDTDGEMIKKMIALNFETAYFTARKVFGQMIKQPQGGRLVFIGAKPALEANAAKSKIAYALSKTLILKLAEILNEEAGGKNVVSSVIVPSIIDSEANRKAMPKANPSDWVTPEQIAKIISFATSEPGDKLREPVLKVYGAS